MTRLAVGAAIYNRQTGGPQRQGRTAATSSLVLEGGRWTARDLRRTCASGMQRLGIMPAVIDAVLNHKESKGVTRSTSGTTTPGRWPTPGRDGDSVWPTCGRRRWALRW